MFKLVSLNENGELLEVVNEVPAFYALYHDENLVGYFVSIEAAKLASEDIMTYTNSTDATVVTLYLSEVA